MDKPNVVTFKKLVMPGDLNPAGNLFGGTMMAWLDKATAMVAMEHSGRNCVTYIVDQLKFIAPVELQCSVEIDVWVEREGKTSLTIRANAYKKLVYSKERKLVVESKFVYVVLDEQGLPTTQWGEGYEAL